jgi:hypothetical protein
MKSSYRATLLVIVCIVVGFGSATLVHDKSANAQPAADRGASRYQISAFAGTTPQGVFHGCYVLDTTTGQVWHVRAGGEPEKVVSELK